MHSVSSSIHVSLITSTWICPHFYRLVSTWNSGIPFSFCFSSILLFFIHFITTTSVLSILVAPKAVSTSFLKSSLLVIRGCTSVKKPGLLSILVKNKSGFSHILLSNKYCFIGLVNFSLLIVSVESIVKYNKIFCVPFRNVRYCTLKCFLKSLSSIISRPSS